jgi:outer membrane lipoprotein SlyB
MKQIVKQSLTLTLALLLVGGNLAVFAQRPYRVNDRQVELLITRIETRTDSFRNISSTALERSRINGTSRENELNNYINEFERATDRLKERFRSRQSVSADVSNVLMQAGQIDRFMRTNLRNSNAERNWANLRSDLNRLAQYYNVNWDWNASNYPNDYSNTGYNNNQNSCFVGTYRLDPSRSDNPSQVVNRSISNVDSRNQDRVRGNLERRLESPEMLTLDRNGQNITIASARAAQVTLVADGQTRTEQNAQGRNTSVVASFNRDRLIVTTSGDRGNDYSVTFEPFDNCRRLRVTRTISNFRVSQPITAQSVYERVSDRAQFDVSNSGNEFPNDRPRANFIIPDGTEVIAVLDSDLNTKEAQDGDSFTMTVRSPRQYDGAVIEGSILGVERSGRITGRAGLNLNFERIRLRNGQTYNFAGTLESARTLDGQNVRIDAEGSVQNEKSQTRDTVTRTGVGAALGAIIGAIAGGGKGAAIGATVGAGAGAGSVVVQGRDDLELKRGTEITLRASAPR